MGDKKEYLIIIINNSFFSRGGGGVWVGGGEREGEKLVYLENERWKDPDPVNIEHRESTYQSDTWASLVYQKC